MSRLPPILMMLFLFPSHSSGWSYIINNGNKYHNVIIRCPKKTCTNENFAKNSRFVSPPSESSNIISSTLLPMANIVQEDPLTNMNANDGIDDSHFNNSISTSSILTSERTFEEEVKYMLSHSSSSTNDDSPTTETSTSALDVLSYHIVLCILQSDLKRLSCIDGSSTGWTSWIDADSESKLRSCIDALRFIGGRTSNNLDPKVISSLSSFLDLDELDRWLRWMKASPSPLVIELSSQLRDAANKYIMDHDLMRVDSTRQELLDRIGCRLILLPSGNSLNHPLQTPTGGMAFGKLLYGGVTRFRLLSGGKRKTGERTVIMTNDNDMNKSNESRNNRPGSDRKKNTHKEYEECWVQYGGPQRKYEALDIGPSAVLEITLLPKGLILSDIYEEAINEMTLTKAPFQMESMFGITLPKEEETKEIDESNDKMSDDISHKTSKTREIYAPISESTESLLKVSGKARNDIFQSSFKSKVGGLQPQIDTIIRRVLDGRIISPILDTGDESNDIESIEQEEIDFDTSSSSLSFENSLLEANELASLGLHPVRGLLLYGKPGNGKTALVREIATVLRARPPKIIAAPELLDRWVGGSERLVRNLFEPAELELKACNGDASKSALHIVVIDEIDAVFRKRTASEDSGETTRNSVVNQILAKMDGIQALPNVLVIGMTNRRELLDDALLRPGRLEVQIEIPSPNQEGRREILQIHFNALRQRGRLSKPLCEAIDGGRIAFQKKNNVEDSPQNIRKREKLYNLIHSSKQKIIPPMIRRQFVNHPRFPIYDLAADSITGGFTGADIAGLVRCAGSLALARARQNGNGIESLLITLDDVKDALVEIKQ